MYSGCIEARILSSNGQTGHAFWGLLSPHACWCAQDKDIVTSADMLGAIEEMERQVTFRGDLEVEERGRGGRGEEG